MKSWKMCVYIYIYIEIEQLVLSPLTYMKVCWDTILYSRCVRYKFERSHTWTHVALFPRIAVTAPALSQSCRRAEMKEWIVSHTQTSSSVILMQDAEPFRPIVHFTFTPGLISQLPGEHLLSRFGVRFISWVSWKLSHCPDCDEDTMEAYLFLLKETCTLLCVTSIAVMYSATSH